MLTTDHDAPRPYPRLSEAQKDRLLAELAQAYALNNLRPVGEARQAPPEPSRDAGAARGERCQQDVEPVLVEDPLGDFVFTLRVCPDCGEEVYQTIVLEGPKPPGWVGREFR
jgi:hypothetical protein